MLKDFIAFNFGFFPTVFVKNMYVAKLKKLWILAVQQFISEVSSANFSLVFLVLLKCTYDLSS